MGEWGKRESGKSEGKERRREGTGGRAGKEKRRRVRKGERGREGTDGFTSVKIKSLVRP